MLRTSQVPIAACLVLMVVAVVLAVRDDKIANLVIGAAVVAITVTAVDIVLKRRVLDAYDEGKRAERRALARDLDELQRRG